MGSGDPYDRYIVGEGLYTVTINSAAQVVYYGFGPKQPGKYRIESWADGIDTKLGDYFANDFYVPETTSVGDDDSGEDLNFSYEIEIKKSNFVVEQDENGNEILRLGSHWTFGFSVKNVDSFPVSFPVVFMQIGESKEAAKPAYTTMKVTEELSQFPDGTTDLVSLRMDGSVETFYNEDDGFYHINSVDGPIVVAKLTLSCEYLDTPIANLQDAGNSALILENKYDYTDFIAKYADYCNNNGVYGVTYELQLFFQRFQKTHTYFGSNGWVQGQLDYEASPDSYWMFASYYYL
jgi:hypothetical protein